MARGSDVLLLIGLVLLAKSWGSSKTAPRPPSSTHTHSPAPPSAPSSTGDVWTENTMRVFVEQMRIAGIDPAVVLLGIAAASNFEPDESMGGYVGLLLLSREDLSSLGYPGVPAFEETGAVFQIPWIGKVIAYRIASTGGRVPQTVPDLAALLHPSKNPNINEALKNHAAQRAKAAEKTNRYQQHLALLRKVQANP